MDDVLTLAELSAYLKVHPRTVRRWLPQGLPALNVGSRARPDWRFVWTDVKTWIEERQRRPAAGVIESAHE